MKIKNLTDKPLQLGDGRMIGAAGTSSEVREYGSPKLTDRDESRCDRGDLQIVEDPKPEAAKEPKKSGGDK